MSEAKRRISVTVLAASAAGAVLLVVFFCFLRSRKVEEKTFTCFALDTVITVKVYDSDGSVDIGKTQEDVNALLSRFELIFSPTDPESELYRINHPAGTESGNSGETETSSGEMTAERSGSVKTAVAISKELYECINLGASYYEITGGRYNIAIRPVSELWNFRDNTEGTVPRDELISEALTMTASPGEYETAENYGAYRYALILKREGISFDLGSVAKGYIGDELSVYCQSNGIESALIDLGGNIVCVGKKPGRTGAGGGDFTVGVRAPMGSSEDLSTTLAVHDKAVVTSGTYQRYFTREGDERIYHHILDATTGYPAETGLVSVTVVSESSAKADVLSTVCFLLGEDAARELLKRENDVYKAVFIGQDGEISLYERE